jgi:hypothetical protein
MDVDYKSQVKRRRLLAVAGVTLAATSVMLVGTAVFTLVLEKAL